MRYTVNTDQKSHGNVGNYPFAVILADTVARDIHEFVWVANEVGETVYVPFARDSRSVSGYIE